MTGPQRTAPLTGPQRTSGAATGSQRTAPLTGPQRTAPVTGPQRLSGPNTNGPGTSLPPAAAPGRGLHRAPGPQQAPGSGTGARRLPGYGTGAQHALGNPTGAQHALGTGAQPFRGNATGAQPVLGTGAQAALGTGAQPFRGNATGAQPVLGTGAQPALGTGAQPLLGNPTGAQPVLGTGAQPVLGTGAQPVLGNATGAQSVLGGRTPVRGFPPRRPESDTSPEFGVWHQPREPFTDDDHELGPDSGYGEGGTGENTRLPDDTGGIARVDPQPPETVAVPVGRRRSAKGKPRRRLLSRAALLSRPALRSRPALLAVVVVVVLAAGFGVYKFFYEPRVNAPVSSSMRLPTSAPKSPDFDQALGKWQHIGTRTEDPGPLTVAGLYPPQFVLNGSSYVRTAASVTTKCSEAVYGAQLQAALQAAHCSQVARASYLSGNGQLMGTVGVVNLITSAAAQKAGQASGPQEVIAPLAAKTGATKKLGDGTGVVLAEVKGHYLILMWAQFANLKSPSTAAARQQLEQFSTDLVTGSANINLSTRMLAGKA